VVTEYGQTVATVSIRYSNSCGTNWIIVDGNPAGGAAIKRIWTDGHPELTETDSGYGWSYSMQVYAPGNTCIHFHVRLLYPDGRHYAETYDPMANHQTVC